MVGIGIKNHSDFVRTEKGCSERVSCYWNPVVWIPYQNSMKSDFLKTPNVPKMDSDIPRFFV